MDISKASHIRHTRKALGISQSQLAAMLGVSVRAVQSYEQGWRPVPPPVQKLSLVLLQASEQTTSAAGKPCWKLRGCPPEERQDCIAYVRRAGGLCWLVTGNTCQGRKHKSWRDKISNCLACPVMLSWMEPDKPRKPRPRPTE